jgi:DNA-binding transcriptional regulator YhcF (GntR family)
MKLMTLVWEDHTGELTGIEKAILLKLADHSSEDGRRIFPSLDTVSNHTGFSRSTVIRTLKTLEEKKRIRRTKRRKGIAYMSNSYIINVNLLHKKAEISRVDKLKKGSVRETLGVVSERHQGSVRETPDPSHDPSLRNNNKEPSVDKSENKEEVAVSKKDVVVDKLVKELKKINVTPTSIEHWIRKYGRERIAEKLEHMKTLTNEPRSRASWLSAALSRGFIKPTELEATSAHASHTLATDTIAHIDAISERARTPKAIAAGKHALAKLKRAKHV